LYQRREKDDADGKTTIVAAMSAKRVRSLLPGVAVGAFCRAGRPVGRTLVIKRLKDNLD
jgi:hypothetical protein